MTNSAGTVREALEQARAALPDALFAVQEGIDRELIVRITLALISINSTVSELKALLVDARDALPIAWNQHGGCSDELLNSIDLTLKNEAGSELEVFASKLS